MSGLATDPRIFIACIATRSRATSSPGQVAMRTVVFDACGALFDAHGATAITTDLPSSWTFYGVRYRITQDGGARLPRPREFDEDIALEAATRCFWAAGYTAASIRDLGDAMRLGPASVYDTFGDKRTLFTICLDRYLDANMRARIARVEKTFPLRQAIEAFLAEIVERSLESRLGCLLANAALEVAPHDPDIADIVAERMDELEASSAAAFARASATAAFV